MQLKRSLLFLLFLVGAGSFLMFVPAHNLRLNQAQGSGGAFESKQPITKDQAEVIVKQLPEVKQFLARRPGKGYNGQPNEKFVEAEERSDRPCIWSVRVAEAVRENKDSGHTATFNWYDVDKKTGNIIWSFFRYENGQFIEANKTYDFRCS